MSIIRLKPIVEGIIKEYSADETKQRSVSIGIDEAKEELNTRFSDAYNLYVKDEDWGLYRGYKPFSYKNNIYFIDPKKSIRTSKETNNFYTYWISNSPVWEDYPPRNQSVIGSFDEGVASDYGPSIFYVVPINGARFAISNNRDAWMSFPHVGSFFSIERNVIGIDSLSDYLSSFFNMAFKVLKLMGILEYNEFSYNEIYELLDRNPEEFLKKIEPHRNDIIDNIENIKTSINQAEYFSSVKKEKLRIFADRVEQYQHLNSFEKMFDDMFDPKKNEIDLVYGIQSLYEKYRSSEYEFWTDAECLLIYDEIFKNIFRGTTI